ncbi:hypothetical protein G7067_11785 [Leucobacter insecticola]|uniref:Uncharacterized protein n=1 Tax=Leucobacter insecticola TaxID=2714934 RepID=A0A6G8FKF9_9MICO|nr:hypothetical protein [Leucobacter insecticola]QIM16926.1 hypothetical protein G7067_11785 [Leucobacter insecticola]
MDYDAVILYSPEYEYKLISGTAEFVRAYIDGAEVDPVAELEAWLRGEADMWKQRGDSEHAAAILRALDMALKQVKLPPSADEL